MNPLDPPELSPVASDLSPEPIVDETVYTGSHGQKKGWIGGPADFFRDDRAKQMGDLVTVNIKIDDKANFNNSTDRSRRASISSDASFDMGILALVGTGKGQLDASSGSSSEGEGTITRSEKLSIALAASVRQVLPNGHLVISGTQEVLVNSEIRILRVEGIVDPKDISRGNAIDYARIAEARISYGGAGNSSDVQRPGWAHQAWDKISPF
ncbi:MAG: flagellar basal body L-ring protein FlgH [Aestuariivirga sp.]